METANDPLLALTLSGVGRRSMHADAEDFAVEEALSALPPDADRRKRKRVARRAAEAARRRYFG